MRFTFCYATSSRLCTLLSALRLRAAYALYFCCCGVRIRCSVNFTSVTSTCEFAAVCTFLQLLRPASSLLYALLFCCCNVRVRCNCNVLLRRANSLLCALYPFYCEVRVRCSVLLFYSHADALRPSGCLLKRRLWGLLLQRQCTLMLFCCFAEGQATDIG